MADVNIASFDVDARAAIAQTNQFIASIDSLEKELIKLQKEGKDTTAVQAQLAQQTANLDKILSQETKTMRGNTAAVQAMIIANNKASQSTKQLTDSQTKLDAAQKKSANSTAAFLARSKNLSGALTRGAAALGNFAGGFGLSGIALGALTGAVEKGIGALTEFFGVSKSVAESQQSIVDATVAVRAEYVSEVRDLNALINPLKDVNTSSSDRAKLIEEIQKRYPEYLKGLGDEAFAVGNVAATQKILNDRIIDGIVLKAQDAERTKITTKLVENQVQIEKLRADGLLDAQKVAEASTKGVFATVNAAFGALSEGLTDADKVIRSSQFVQLEKDQKALAEENKKLDETFKNTANSLKKLNIDLGENKSVANEVLNTTEKTASAKNKQTKATKDQSDAIAKLNEEVAKELDLRLKQQAEAEQFAGTIGALKKELADLQNVIENQTKTTDFAQFERLTAQADALKKEIATLETALESYGKVAEEIRRPPADTTTFEREVEQAKLALGELRTEQFESDLARAKLENDALQRAGGNAQKEAEARKFWSNEAEKAKREQAKQTLILQIDLARKELVLAQQTGELFGQEATDAKNELLALELQLAELTNTEYTVNIDVNDEDAKKKLKETTLAAIDFTQQAADQTFAFFAAQNQQLIAGLDNAVSAQENALNALLNNEATTNVELVRLEQERLDKLNAERKKAAEKEAIIAQAQIAVNLALAVSKAAVEGGGIASVFTIASLLAAAAFGFIQAKQAAANAYAEGTLYVDDKRAPNGKDTVPAWLDKGEAVITKQRNKQYANTVRAVHFGEVPAEYLDKAIRDYKSGSHLSDIGLGSVGLSTRSTKQAREERANRNKSAQVLTVSGGTSRTELTAALNYIGASLEGLNKQKMSGANLLTVVQSRANNISKMKNKARGKHG